MNRTYIGIDNGPSGTVSVIYPDGKWNFRKTPVKNEQDYTKTVKYINRLDWDKFYKMLKSVKKKSDNILVVLERPLKNSQMFNASISGIRVFEAQLVMIETLGLKFEVIDSKQWQTPLLPKMKKEPNRNKRRKKLKLASQNVGKRLYPGSEKVHEDADGLLIAEWARREKL